MKMTSMEMTFESFRLYQPQPGDVLIVRPRNEKILEPKQIEQIRETLKAIVPEYVTVLVLSSELEIEVIHPGETK